MKHVMFAIALIAGMLATGAAIEISEADILSGDIRKSPLLICRNSEADVYAETLTAVKPTVKSKGDFRVKVYYATAAAVQYGYANPSCAYADILSVYQKELADLGVATDANIAQAHSMLLVNPWVNKIKSTDWMEAAIKAGEGKQAAAFERAQLMRHLNYSVEDLEKAYAATGHNSAEIQSILLGIYCDNGVADKASKTFFQLALSGKLTSDTALAQFDRVYPLILAESTDNAVLAKKLEMIVRIYTVKYRAWEAQNPKQDATNNPWHMFINSVQDQINGLTGK